MASGTVDSREAVSTARMTAPMKTLRPLERFMLLQNTDVRVFLRACACASNEMTLLPMQVPLTRWRPLMPPQPSLFFVDFWVKGRAERREVPRAECELRTPDARAFAFELKRKDHPSVAGSSRRRRRPPDAPRRRPRKRARLGGVPKPEIVALFAAVEKDIGTDEDGSARQAGHSGTNLSEE